MVTIYSVFTYSKFIFIKLLFKSKRLLTGEGDKEKVNYSRKDCIMMILAMEAGLDIPEVMFEVIFVWQ